MEKDKHITEVVFRVDTTKDFKGTVFALFPHEVCDYNGNVTSYGSLDGHSAADYNHCIKTSRPATTEEYSDLEGVLSRIGYNLKVVKKQTYSKYLTDYKRVRGITV